MHFAPELIIGLSVCCCCLLNTIVSTKDPGNPGTQVEDVLRKEDCEASSENYKRLVHEHMMDNDVDDYNHTYSLPDWTTKMLDATGKWPTEAFPREDLEWLGNISNCLEINVAADEFVGAGFQGQYCNAKLTMEFKSNRDTTLDLAIDDNHRSLPNSSLVDINGGVCWPSSCNPQQTEQQFASMLRMLNVTFEDFRIDHTTCYVAQIKSSDVAFIVSLTFCFLFACLILIGSVFNAWDEDIGGHRKSKEMEDVEFEERGAAGRTANALKPWTPANVS